MNDRLARIAAVEKELLEMKRHGDTPTTQDRARILLAYLAVRNVAKVARTLRHARSSINHIIALFLKGGLEALRDRRRNGNIRIKRREEILALLPELVAKQPPDFGWRRSTWTIELIAKEVASQLKVWVSCSQMGRLLHKMKCHLIKPKQTIRLAPANREELIAELDKVLSSVPPEDVVLWGDEVDIHLNPKIGRDWAPAGVRKELVTPGQNKKWYLAGAFNKKTKNLITVDGPSKNSDLFIALVRELAARYRAFGIIHLVVDNYIIHKSKKTEKAIKELGGKVVLHFLPPYSPDYNPIERVWWDLHDNVTRNHRCPDIETLLDEVREFVSCFSRRGGRLAGLDRKKSKGVSQAGTSPP